MGIGRKDRQLGMHVDIMRRDVLATSFETFERNIRDELNRILGDDSFDAARDIAGIMVNR